MQTVLAVLIILSVLSIAWSMGFFKRYQLINVRDIDERVGEVRFNIDYLVFSPLKRTLKEKSVKVVLFDGDLYIDDGYMTPLMWESEKLANDTAKMLMDLNVSLV
ncbi:phosphatidylglycerol--membrane-oligosaccharide glycerophosphotransferase [Vibrio phage vB_VpaS_1601]|uniref:phosphatidylglycerol--membrane-oligosaccharide glycerophosphotransferase n=1 Tax=Vibrio phage SHOU24 TaxID=1414739 RepID=UPI0003ED1C4F|nr:phosphatidylglycerol--membrane-oligosaccharide glycerophosphotransferase [Vibrio phage SHOU24]AHI61292.1 phosphatidylglycerol--membrane-oligosaccharide glycerophosphotransferase [Vibrio phage SHOU24]WHM52774.1 phosphatidylglycerol--membrane-oligosaccharide glycerophosphotransferase [Vibrio phage vB_VpaP_1601]